MVALGWRANLLAGVPGAAEVISVLWIVGLVNSFNMLDNMDGLSAGVAAIAAAVLAVVMFLSPRPDNHQPQLFVSGLLLVILGSLLGFLWHNRPPARLFMGDAGSYLVGYLLAMVTLTATFAGGGAPRHATLVPLCVLAVPIYDTLSVVLIRLRQGRSPFVGDTSHFSHRLTALGMTKTQAVLTIYLAAATCGLGGLLLHQVDRFRGGRGPPVGLLHAVVGGHPRDGRPAQGNEEEIGGRRPLLDHETPTSQQKDAATRQAARPRGRPDAAVAVGRGDGPLGGSAAVSQRSGGHARRRPARGHALAHAGRLLVARRGPRPAVFRSFRLDRRGRGVVDRRCMPWPPSGRPDTPARGPPSTCSGNGPAWGWASSSRGSCSAARAGRGR